MSSEPPKFECAPGMRLQAHEKLTDVHFVNVNDRLRRIEAAMERLEKRLWLAVYGVVAVILTQGVQGLVSMSHGLAP
ncbi:hypothetical protein E4Z66_01670 [Aliishimia ponticola]|uniref:Uncharacterized protein n=1 Tax=Aliishimia ponticola TaxID=2499833 RepID=A0A4S4NHG9_9RHOB|nr:hypothetical protein [Aliishimia ponticola]THH38305.1 hypothetical protein E4Z66_01670 [Aliishimia ponticola]